MHALYVAINFNWPIIIIYSQVIYTMTLDLEVAAIFICIVSLSCQSKFALLIFLTKCLPLTCVNSLPIVSFPDLDQGLMHPF